MQGLQGSPLDMADARAELADVGTRVVGQIKSECDLILSSSSHESRAWDLSGCGRALVSLLAQQATRIAAIYSPQPAPDQPRVVRLTLKRLDDIISIAYSKFYAFLFKDLPFCWRQLYTDASILKFCLLLSQKVLPIPGSLQPEPQPVADDEALTELIKTLDLALILAGGAGEKRGRYWINSALEVLHRAWLAGQDGVSSALGEGPNRSFSRFEPFTPPVTHPIRRLPAMSMESFQSYMDNAADPTLGPMPIVLTGITDEWPARTTNPWDKPSYLLSRTFDGRRLVPVEIGRSYVDEGWGQKLITFGELLRVYIDPSLSSPSHAASTRQQQQQQQPPPPTAYLAQHGLFTQLPALRGDILVPDYCYTSPPPPPPSTGTHPPPPPAELDEPLLNAWFGPPGTITPLHTDPYHNMLVQVVGRKYVRLYAPRETGQMRARGKEDGVEMGNTSGLDVGAMEGWDRDEDHNDPDEGEAAGDGGQPQGYEGRARARARARRLHAAAAFREVPFADAILEPGDALYIPVGWWHYVRGLSVSFSVSFWWN